MEEAMRGSYGPVKRRVLNLHLIIVKVDSDGMALEPDDVDMITTDMRYITRDP